MTRAGNRRYPPATSVPRRISRPVLSLARRGLALLREAERLLPGLVPYLPGRDVLLARLLHLVTHQRQPCKQLLWNDVGYRIKCGGALKNADTIRSTDKEFFKAYLRERLGEDFVIPTIAILKTPNAVRNYQFPARCCIKPTHSNAQVIIREAGEPVDIEKIVAWLSWNFYAYSGEANHRTLEPKIIVEPLVFDNPNADDIKLFCVDGKARMVQIHQDRKTRHTLAMFDLDWNMLPVRNTSPLPKMSPPRPVNLARMIEIAERLASEFFIVRVDLYSDGEGIKVGEITHCPAGALATFTPREGEVTVSNLLFSDVPDEKWDRFFG